MREPTLADDPSIYVARTLAPEATVRLGARLGRVLHVGDVILLRGDLGAGKTHFARGVVMGLGITGPVPSPTFTLANEYDGMNVMGDMVPLAHLDLYRLGDSGDLDSVGLADYVSEIWATVIEWPERAMDAGFVPASHLDIAFLDAGEGERQLIFTAHGSAMRLLNAVRGEAESSKW